MCKENDKNDTSFLFCSLQCMRCLQVVGWRCSKVFLLKESLMAECSWTQRKIRKFSLSQKGVDYISLFKTIVFSSLQVPDSLAKNTDFVVRSRLHYFEIVQILHDNKDQSTTLLFRFAAYSKWVDSTFYVSGMPLSSEAVFHMDLQTEFAFSSF